MARNPIKGMGVAELAAKRAAMKNPALRQVYGSFDAYGKRRFFGPSQNEWGISQGFPFELESVSIHGNAPIAFSKTRAYVCVDEDERGPVVEVWPIRNLAHPGVPNMSLSGWKRRENPGAASKRVRVIGSNPGARNIAAPRPKKRENWPRYVVEEKEGVGPWMPRASFRIIEDAEKLARDIHKAQPSIAVRVIDTKS